MEYNIKSNSDINNVLNRKNHLGLVEGANGQASEQQRMIS